MITILRFRSNNKIISITKEPSEKDVRQKYSTHLIVTMYFYEWKKKLRHNSNWKKKRKAKNFDDDESGSEAKGTSEKIYKPISVLFHSDSEMLSANDLCNMRTSVSFLKLFFFYFSWINLNICEARKNSYFFGLCCILRGVRETKNEERLHSESKRHDN